MVMPANGSDPGPASRRHARVRRRHGAAPSRVAIFMHRRQIMIKNFDYMLGNETIELCASFGAGPAFRRVLVSRADSMETLVVLDARGLSGLLKVATEEPEGLLDDAIRKVGDEQLVERAINGRTIVEAAL
ncbi:hypothetical protein BCO37747_03689 [Burkholderia contaminans]|jgi:hypothetical protein|nr:hypothetical protein SK875_B01275 [Burkholderia contaminans]VWD17667.1 hypothetical protein BCO37747_03689 [Burkholderia contaminans]